MRTSGIVKWYDDQRGFGFITGQDNVDYFFNVSFQNAEIYNDTLRQGDFVEFTAFSFKGGPIARNVVRKEVER